MVHTRYARCAGRAQYELGVLEEMLESSLRKHGVVLPEADLEYPLGSPGEAEVYRRVQITLGTVISYARELRQGKRQEASVSRTQALPLATTGCGRAFETESETAFFWRRGDWLSVTREAHDGAFRLAGQKAHCAAAFRLYGGDGDTVGRD